MSIGANQRAASLTRFQRALPEVVRAFAGMSEPRRAASLALLAAATETPVRITLLGINGDADECARVLDGTLAKSCCEHTWDLGAGLGEFVVHMTPDSEEHHHE